jgi:murein DD-endopeptidase MepM/ murein hydrolase activator NlpD
MQRLAFGIVGALAFLSLASPASALPDGPIEPYLEHQESVVPYVWPANGSLTDGFGPRWGRLHAGLDIGILASLDVVAAREGLVTQTGYLTGFEGYGNVVLVDLGEGLRTLYAHLSQIDVRPGQWVSTGQRLGLAGCTGSCTGTHLHFELHRGGTPVDPLPLFDS